MSHSLLEKAFKVEDFRTLGHQLVDLLSDHISEIRSNPEKKVIPYNKPENELAYWKKDLSDGGEPIDLFRNILDHSIDVHHQRYIGHQVSVPALISSLAGLMSDVLSNGTGVYEMGMASNAIEKIVTDFLAQKIGFDLSSSGFITSGGSLANLTALLAARKARAPAPVWEKGHSGKLAVMVSEEAHYCIDRAARILGMGNEGIIKIPVDNRFKIRHELLETYLDSAKAKSIHVIAIVGCACSTATGSFDDLNALADFSEKHNIWFHVDGAHGGAVIFSDKYKHLAAGIQRADSVVVDFHKMMLTPSLNTALIFKNGLDSYKTFEQNAHYLWEVQQSPEWYHSGKRTFECTKLMSSIKMYSILRTYGERVFEENVNRLFDLAKTFSKIIQNRPGFELANKPEANIVNFRIKEFSNERSNQLNARIRKEIVEAGKFYFVQTVIKGIRFLRVTVMNPFTTEDDLVALLDEVEEIKAKL